MMRFCASGRMGLLSVFPFGICTSHSIVLFDLHTNGHVFVLVVQGRSAPSEQKIGGIEYTRL